MSMQGGRGFCAGVSRPLWPKGATCVKVTKAFKARVSLGLKVECDLHTGPDTLKVLTSCLPHSP